MYIVPHSFHEAMVHGDQGAWKPVPLTGAVPSHRQSLALCGAPGRIPGASSGHGVPHGFPSMGFLNINQWLYNGL